MLEYTNEALVQPSPQPQPQPQPQHPTNYVMEHGNKAFEQTNKNYVLDTWRRGVLIRTLVVLVAGVSDDLLNMT